MNNARNPSACCAKRVSTAQAKLAGQNTKDRKETPILDQIYGKSQSMSDRSLLSEEVEDFIEHNQVDGMVGDELRQADPKIQRLVLEEGNLGNARNPIAC